MAISAILILELSSSSAPEAWLLLRCMFFESDTFEFEDRKDADITINRERNNSGGYG